MHRRWLALGVCLTLALAIGAAQQAPAPSSDAIPSFRSGIDVVELDVSVLDKDRLPVHGLTAADFTVLEDGTPQPIVAFDAVNLPEWTQTSAPWMRDVASDVVTNRLGTERVIVMILKDVFVPLSEMQDTKRIAREIVDGMGPNDVAAVVYTFHRDKGQEFTSDRARLLAAIDRFSVAFGDDTRIANPFSASERGPQSDPMANDPRRKPGPATEVCPGDICVTQAMRNAADILRKWPGGRKTMVLVSPAIRRGAGATPAGQTNASQKNDSQETFAAMQEANANLYQIDPLGLQVAPRPLIDPTTTLAEQTGGRVLTGANNPWRLVPQMLRENGSYYLLGFRRTNAAADGSFHRLTVRVARPDVEVRTRSGYFAPSPTKTATSSTTPAMSPLDAAIARSLPTGDLPMTLAVAPFAVPGKRTAALAIVAGLDVTGPTPAGEVFDVQASAFQTDFKPAGSITQKVEVQRGPASASSHADVVSRLDLPPGRYEVRVAIDSPSTGRTGSAYTTVIVPDFAKEPLALSGVVIARGTGSAATGALASVLPVAPTTMREFARSEGAIAFVRIYHGGKAAPTPVQITARLVNESDQAVLNRVSTFAPAAFGAARSADYRLDLPLAELAPGRYLFTVEAVAGGQSVRRDVRLTIK